MLKVEIDIPRDILHYTLEKLSLIEAIEDVRVTLTEKTRLKSKFDTNNAAKIEFITDDDIADDIIQLLLTDPKVQDGRIDIMNVERSLMLSSKESKKIKILLSGFVRAPRKEVYSFITNYAKLQEELPEYIKSFDIINKSENVTIIEECINIDGITIQELVKHVAYEPAVHEVEILSGYLEGSKIIETYTDLGNGTEIMIIGDFRVAKELEKIIDSEIKVRIENSIRKVISRVTKIIESRYGIEDKW